MVNHAIQLKGSYALLGTLVSERPSLLQFKEQNFVENLLSGLKSESGREILSSKLLTSQDNEVLRLYQPVHRLFNVLLLDISCAQFGSPRLDASKIESSGFVLRKVDDEDNQREYGWLKRDGKLLGWTEIAEIKSNQKKLKHNYDVDPEIRQSRQLGRNRQALKTLYLNSVQQNDFYETDTSLFLTSPEIMQNASKTYLYGIINVASGEWSESEETDLSTPFTEEDIQQRLPVLFQQGNDERFDGSNERPPLNTMISSDNRINESYQVLISTLDYLANEVGLFTDGETTAELKNVLENISVHISISHRNSDQHRDENNNYYDFLYSCYVKLYGLPQDAEGNTVTVDHIYSPHHWPYISADEESQIIAAVNLAMQSRWEKLKPATPKFETQSKYRIYAYARVQGEVGCPVQTVWSLPTEDFEIIPWYETSDLIPPAQIELPDVNLETLSKLKPNVAFKVPESIQKIMDKVNLKDLMDGKDNSGPGLGFGMICGFSIPLITICAFIVLQIFLMLLNLVFWWLPFIKICIPFPKPK